MARIYQ